jgi:hypothetical protein
MIVRRYQAQGPGSVLTGLVKWVGGGGILVSLLPLAMLAILPWSIGLYLPFRSMSALNGQIWLIRGDDYHNMEPHARHRDFILEDVSIGRYLKAEGFRVYVHNLRDVLSVRMYGGLGDAWLGFRRNSALLMGGRPPVVIFVISVWLAIMIVPLFLEPLLLVPFYGLKLGSDRYAGYPLWITMLAPVSAILGTLVVLSSLWTHWRGIVTWKERVVS